MNGTHLVLIGLMAGIAFLPTLDFSRVLAKLDLWHCKWALRSMHFTHPDWSEVRARVIDLELALER